MIVHLCSDNNLIDHCVINTFEKHNPKKNIYLIISFYKTLSFVKKTEQVTILDPSDIEILNICNKASAVIVHGMTREKAVWIPTINKNVNVLWSCWGSDFYGLKQFREKKINIYENFTNQIKNKKNPNSLIKKIKYRFLFVFLTYCQIRHTYPPLFDSLEKAFKRIDFLSTVISTEFNLIKDTLPELKNAQYLDFSYGDIKYLLGPFYNKEYSLGKNIMIGHSGSISNNHIDTLLFLKNLNISNKIICPLSYGEDYIKSIIKKKGSELFGDNFEPLTIFLPLDKYIKIISSCSVMIMNQRRQEAVGNIVIGLYLGMRIFLNNKNPVFCFLKQNGFIVFDFYNDFTNSSKHTSPLTSSEREINRNALEKIWGKEIVEKQISSTIRTLLN